MKYYAFIDGEEKGPFELDDLRNVGVRPSTYVWTKGMDDWQRADEVPEVCRLFRRHLSELMHPAAPAPEVPPEIKDEKEQNVPPKVENLDDVPLQFRRMVEKSGTTPGPANSMEPDYNQPPRVSMLLAILSMLICFLPTGIVCVVLTYKAQSAWMRSSTGNSRESEELRRQAHEYARLAKMWLGITVAFGFILIGFLISRNW